jgi:ABC-type branched-subunit amino acid transport system ATPase component/branched-subunit amino acid ABC-type transport system permease component
MRDILVFSATGLGQGAVFAALALGLLVTFKGTGVINFAAGAMGAWCAFVYGDLRTNGTLVLPIGRFDLGDPMGTVPAIAVATITGIVLGLLVQVLVFKHLRTAPALAKVVASAGLMLAFQALIVLRFGSDPRVVAPILPSETVSIGGGTVPRDRLWLAAIVVLIAIVVAVWFRVSRGGLAIRAAADNEGFVSLAGYSPDKLAATAWAIATGIIAFVAVLASPIVGISPVTFTLFIVPALACLLVGRLSSIGLAVGAGLFLGALNANITYWSTKSWWPDWASKGVSSAIPLIAIIVMLFFLGKRLPTRADSDTARLPKVVSPRMRPLTVGIVVVAGAAAVIFTSASYRFGVITSMAVALVALSFVVLTGLLGQVSMAQAAFAGLAGFLLSRFAVSLDIGFPLGPILASLAAMAFGLLAGVPALRIRGVQLAVVTLALALAFEQLVLSNNELNGASGNPVPPPRIFGIDLSIRGGSNTARFQYGLPTLAVLTIGAILVGNLARSGTGKRFLAVRSNERASASVGIDVTRAKLFGFGLSAFLAGLGGCMIGYAQGSVSATSYTVLVGVTWLVFAYLGGISSISGALVAGTFAPLGITFVVVDRWIGASNGTYQLIAAIGLIMTTIFNPEGIAGAMHERLEHMRKRRKPKVGIGAERAQVGAPAEAVTGTFTREPSSAVATPAVPVATRALLSTRDVTVRFGTVVAVNQVSIDVGSGRIVGLIGANGAGKTTLIDAISGFVPYTGRVTMEGTSLDDFPAYRRSRAGLSRTWQSLELFRDLTVRENLEVAADHPSFIGSMLDLVHPSRAGARRDTDEALALLNLQSIGDHHPDELTLGQQKLVNVARALVGGPHVLLLDEPAAGLSTSETAALGRALRTVIHDDIGILLVEHDVALVFDICDDVYVLDEGSVIAEGPPSQVRDDPAVVSAYLGTGKWSRETDASAPEISGSPA